MPKLLLMAISLCSFSFFYQVDHEAKVFFTIRVIIAIKKKISYWKLNVPCSRNPISKTS
jgi:hypothetical protein